MLTDDQLRAFGRDGYVLLRDVVPEALLAAADAEIDALPAPPDGTVGPHFHFLPPGDLPAADAALRASSALALAEELVAPHRLHLGLGHIQVALNVPVFDHVPGGPHLDGHRPDTPIASFTLLAGIFLVDESVPHRGNLWVWPGSHLEHQQLFRERGTGVLSAVGGHPTMLDPPLAYARPKEPLLARRGDLLLAHFLLGHNIGGNTGDDVRRILYYRLAAEGHADRWEQTFADALTEYAPVAGL